MQFEGNVKRVQTGKKEVVAFELSPENQAVFWSQVKEYEGKGGPVYHLVIKNRYKPRTTGQYSQNHKINGMVQQIAAQMDRSFEAVKMSAKLIAVENGNYPYEMMEVQTKTGIMEILVPASEKNISTTEASDLIEALYALAAEHGVEIVEGETL